jgi:ubiquinone/menaquinone biosynthesis C-methylase UbiE
MPESDIWSRWLLKNRFGGNVELHKKVLETKLYPVRDKVLSQAGLPSGGTLLDAGCGDGLIAFGALEKFSGSQVIFTDISAPLLEQCRLIAEQMGVLGRCRFVQAPAENLAEIGYASIDAVTTRSVLIYIKPKQQAFDEFYRVLKPGGWISLFEPINRFCYPEPEGFFLGYDVRPVVDLAQKVEAIYAAIQPMDDPMLDFDERDLIAFAERAGFSEIHLEQHADIQPTPEVMPWDTFWKMAPNPKVPTVGEAIQQALTPDETERFIAVLRPLVETNQSQARMAVAYLWAKK